MRSPLRAVIICLALASVPAVAVDPDPAPPGIIGPFVQNVQPTSAIIHWATLAGRLQPGNETAPRASAVRPVYAQHEQRVYLEPGGAWRYDLPGVGTGTIQPPPDRGQAAEFSFAVMGDTQSGEAAHRALVKRMAECKPAFVLQTGDLVDWGADPRAWARYFEVTGELMRTTPYYPCAGNHEDGSSLFTDFFSLPGNEWYYSFNWGPVHVAVLDLNPPAREFSGAAYSEQEDLAAALPYAATQLAWLQRDLAEAGAQPLKIVMLHRPLLSAMPAHAAEIPPELRQAVLSVLRQAGVSMVLSGHDHCYEHALKDGVHHVVVSGSAGPREPTEGNPQADRTVKLAAAHTFLAVTVKGETLSCEARDEKGAVLDAWTVGKAAPPR